MAILFWFSVLTSVYVARNSKLKDESRMLWFILTGVLTLLWVVFSIL